MSSLKFAFIWRSRKVFGKEYQQLTASEIACHSQVAEQSRAEQSRAEQGRAEQGRAGQQ